MKKFIVTGKGGSGKTTFTKILLDSILLADSTAKILVIDADPSATLHLKLNVDVSKVKPLGELEGSEVLESSDSTNEEKTEFINKEVFKKYFSKVNYEKRNIYYGMMGHHTRNSCLCGYNNILNLVLKTIENLKNTNKLSEEFNFDYILLDREAGVEHLSRSVYKGDNNRIFILSWPSEDYLKVAREINDLADILGTTKNRTLVINDVFGELETQNSSNNLDTFVGDITSFINNSKDFIKLLEEHNLEEFLKKDKGIIHLPNLKKHSALKLDLSF